MNLWKYFLLYCKLTNKRILVVIVFSFLLLLSQSILLSAMATASQYGNEDAKGNAVAKTFYVIFGYFGCTDPQLIFIVLLIIVACSALLTSSFFITNDYYIAKVQAKLYIDIQSTIMQKLLGAEYEYFTSRKIGHFNNVVIKQLLGMASSFKFFATIIVGTFNVISFLIIPFWMNPFLAFFLTIILFPLVIPMRIINRKTKDFSILRTKEMTNMNSILIQILTNYKYLKSTGEFKQVLRKLRQVATEFAMISKRLVVLGSFSGNGILPLAICLICGLIYWQVIVMEVPIVNAAMILGLLYMAASRFNAVPIAYQKFLTSSGAILIYEEMIGELEEHQENMGSGKNLTPDFAGNITFSNITFKYRSADEPTLKNIDLDIPPYSMIAFVGGSGAGKSTIVNLISGLLKPTKGTMRISDNDYADVNLAALRSGIGYVTQEPVIFNDSVNDNISLWDNECSSEDVLHASKIANAHDFISELPSRYETMLGDNGVNISGGQRQRICIAREFLRDTPLLILDEATSSLDSENEQVIQKSINEFHGKKTIVIIAHRLSTIKKCDTIFVMDNGKISGSGSYDGLIANNELFKDMVKRQSL